MIISPPASGCEKARKLRRKLEPTVTAYEVVMSCVERERPIFLVRVGEEYRNAAATTGMINSDGVE